MLYGGRDPVTGQWRELRTDEYRYKRSWNSVVWWTIGNQANPMPIEYKATLSDPYLVFAKLPVSSPVPDIAPVIGMPTPDILPKAIRDKVPEMQAPIVGGIALGVLLLAGIAYKFKDELKRKANSVKGWIGLKRSRKSRR